MTQIPSQFTSAQTLDANIFIVGGTRQTQGQPSALAETLMIDANMNVYERDPMK